MLEENVAVAASPVRSAPPIHRVLVAFDGSPGAWAALRHGIAVAEARHALLTIAAVVEDPPIWVGLPPFVVPWTRESLRGDAERRLARLLAAARDEVPATVSVCTTLLHGRTARALADLAEGGGYDLVVTGPGRGGGRRRRWGRGVPGALMARCHAAVLAVRPSQPA
jgi:nucleotide-binding universal stress UspA family protein